MSAAKSGTYSMNSAALQDNGDADQVALLTETNNRLKKKLIEMVKALDQSQKATKNSQLGSSGMQTQNQFDKQI